MTRVAVVCLLAPLLGCSSSRDGVASTSGQTVEILPAPSGSSAALARLRALPKVPDKSQRGHWYSDETEALALAHDEGRPLLIDFTASWSGPCKELEKRVYPALAAELDRFVLLRVDATDTDDPRVVETMTRYKVMGMPAVLALDAKGNEAVRINQFLEADAMREALAKVP